MNEPTEPDNATVAELHRQLADTKSELLFWQNKENEALIMSETRKRQLTEKDARMEKVMAHLNAAITRAEKLDSLVRDELNYFNEGWKDARAKLDGAHMVVTALIVVFVSALASLAWIATR